MKRDARDLPLSTDSAEAAELFDRAQQVIPGGVNSPVRAFRAVGGTALCGKSVDQSGSA